MVVHPLGLKMISADCWPKDMANVSIYRQGGFLYGGVRAIVRLNGTEVGSLYPKDFIKFYAPEGSSIIT